MYQNGDERSTRHGLEAGMAKATEVLEREHKTIQKRSTLTVRTRATA